MPKPEAFRFRKLDTVGAPDAEQDDDFLSNCFIDTGLLDVLRDCGDPRRLIVGRTGSGKTALIHKLKSMDQKVIMLRPEQLAIPYIANSDILTFVMSLGVKLDLFFRLLWRHVLIVEIMRKHSALDSEISTKNLLDRLRHKFDRSRQASLDRVLTYMQEFGGSFWEETERRVKEITHKMERDIKASVSTGATLPVTFGLDGSKSMSQEERSELSYRAQNVVNSVQARELTEMVGLLDVILDDPQQQFYVVIDRLDEDWVDDRMRYALIRALLETVREFHKVRNAKVIVALRLDLVDRVFAQTRDAGFQQEKYEGEIVRLQWSADRLLTVLDARVNRLVRRSYTGAAVTHHDVMPKRIGTQKVSEFMIDRTLMRPRDIIQFFNACIRYSEGNPQISEKAVLQAEGEYSRDRLQALADEWYADYPNLLACCIPLLSRRPPYFEVGAVTEGDIQEFCLKTITTTPFDREDVISKSTLDVAEGRMTAAVYWLNAVEMFYRVGLIGLKPEQSQPLMWASDTSGRRTISTSEINTNSRVAIHKCFWRVLGVSERRVDDGNNRSMES